jgi:anti-anti-sigma factor
MKIHMVNIGKDGVIRLAANGSLMATDFDPDGTNLLQKVLGPNWSQMRLVLDMDKCTYVDSSAIGWLISTQKECRGAGGQVVLHSVQPSVRQVLDLLKVGRVVPLVEDEPAALAVLQNGGAA